MFEITIQELQGLLSLLARLPMTQTESIFVDMIAKRAEAYIESEKARSGQVQDSQTKQSEV